MNRSRTDSVMEAVTNTFIGFWLSFVCWAIVAHLFRIPMPLGTNLQITGIFTVVSIARQYVLRRAFNGRTVWQSIKARFGIRYHSGGVVGLRPDEVPVIIRRGEEWPKVDLRIDTDVVASALNRVEAQTHMFDVLKRRQRRHKPFYPGKYAAK